MKVKAWEIKTENQLQNTLDKMYELSKEGNEPFYNLIELMCNEQTVMTAMRNIRSNKGSKTAGIDNKNIDTYLQKSFEDIMSEIKNAILNYNPLPVRRKWIPKGNGKLRPLGIPSMLDRIIQEILRITIEPILEAKFYHYSFGFRPYRDASQAMAEIIERIRRNQTYWVIEGDIKSYFDNINHNKLITILWTLGIKDKRILSLIKKMLKSGVIEEDGKLYPSNVGSPQGGIISPLLANVYLNFFDWMIAKKFQEHPAKHTVKDISRSGLNKVRRRHDDIYIIRYADDWVILCKTEEQAKNTLSKVEKYFKHQLKMELAKDKTLITNVLENKAKFLGFEFFAEKSRTSNKIVGKFIPNTKKSTEKVREIGREIRKINHYYTDKRNMAIQIEKINSVIVGLTQYYCISNCNHFFKAWDNRINYQAYKTFTRVTGIRDIDLITSPASKLDNRRTRHEKRNDKLFSIEVDGVKIGLTKFSLTPSTIARKVNLELTPYSDKGRKIYQMNSDRSLPLMRTGTIYTWQELLERRTYLYQAPNSRMNFEYLMNREYAYNRDRGKCRCCGDNLILHKYECHHIRPRLPIDKVNKVGNLASLCRKCHDLIHGKEENLINYPENLTNKINKYRLYIQKE